MNGVAVARRSGYVPAEPIAACHDVRSLYVHIPFCERKCEYCDFTSIAGLRKEAEYISALRHEILLLGRQLAGITLDTVFIGGGTPSLVDPRLIADVVEAIHEAFAVAADAELTLEANPSSTSLERARVWRSCGFTRVSLGVQSLEPEILKFLGRVHDSQRALQAARELHAAGFENVNCDLIYAVPGLDDATWERTLADVVRWAPSHVSCYELTVEPGTPLHRNVQHGRITPAAAETALRQHRTAVDVLEAAGFMQYEVSNFAAPSARCRHNLNYWRNGYYLAAGVGAHGHVPRRAAPAIGIDSPPNAVAVRFWHGKGIAAYIDAVASGLLPLHGHEAVDAKMRDAEGIMLGLRLRDGITVHDGALRAQAAVLARDGLLEPVDATTWRTTPRGEQVLNAIALRLVEAA